LLDQYLPIDGGIAVKARIRYTGDDVEGKPTEGCLDFQAALNGLDGSRVVTVPYQLLPNFTTWQYLCVLSGGYAEGWILVDASSTTISSIAVTLPGTNPPEVRDFSVR
jgi:hypothetical protein